MLRPYLFFSCISFPSFSGAVLAEINSHGSLYRIGYNSGLENSKNHMKFSYGGNILEVDYGSYNENTGIGIDNGGSPLPSLNNTISKQIKMSWREYKDNLVKKARDGNINSNNRKLSQLNDEYNFSQYLKLDWNSPCNAPLGCRAPG